MYCVYAVFDEGKDYGFVYTSGREEVNFLLRGVPRELVERTAEMLGELYRIPVRRGMTLGSEDTPGEVLFKTSCRWGNSKLFTTHMRATDPNTKILEIKPVVAYPLLLVYLKDKWES